MYIVTIKRYLINLKKEAYEKEHFIGECFVIYMVITLGVSISRTQNVNSDLFSLVGVEQLSYAEVIGPVEVTCSGGSSGTCFKMGYQEGLYGTCYFFCTFTEYQSDYCSSWYVNLVNFCTIIGGI